MAIYHLSAKIFKRSAGHSAVAAAAYRSGSALVDKRTGERHDFTRKQAVDGGLIMLPSNAPAWLGDRQKLWESVEATERRKDAQLAREIEISLPVELPQPAKVDLAKAFAQELVDQGMIADLNFHHLSGDNPHCHIMLTMRDIDPAAEHGLGKKNRDWNAKDTLEHWRTRWADIANEHLAEHGHDARIDHRSLEAQGIQRPATTHLGQFATAELRRQSERFLKPGLSPEERKPAKHKPTAGSAWQQRISERIEERIEEIKTEAQRVADALFPEDNAVETVTIRRGMPAERAQSIRAGFLGEVDQSLGLEVIGAQRAAQAARASVPAQRRARTALGQVQKTLDTSRLQALIADPQARLSAVSGHLSLIDSIRIRDPKRAEGYEAAQTMRAKDRSWRTRNAELKNSLLDAKNAIDTWGEESPLRLAIARLSERFRFLRPFVSPEWQGLVNRYRMIDQEMKTEEQRRLSKVDLQRAADLVKAVEEEYRPRHLEDVEFAQQHRAEIAQGSSTAGQEQETQRSYTHTPGPKPGQQLEQDTRPKPRR